MARELTFQHLDGKVTRTVELVHADCPDCPGRFSISSDAEGTPVVLHTLPYCGGFEALDTAEGALAYVRRARAREESRRAGH